MTDAVEEIYEFADVDGDNPSLLKKETKDERTLDEVRQSVLVSIANQRRRMNYKGGMIAVSQANKATINFGADALVGQVLAAQSIAEIDALDWSGKCLDWEKDQVGDVPGYSKPDLDDLPDDKIPDELKPDEGNGGGSGGVPDKPIGR